MDRVWFGLSLTGLGARAATVRPLTDHKEMSVCSQRVTAPLPSFLPSFPSPPPLPFLSLLLLPPSLPSLFFSQLLDHDTILTIEWRRRKRNTEALLDGDV